MPQREELTRAPQGALPFPAQSRWARRVPLAIEGKGEGNGQVRRNPQEEGDGGERSERSVLVQILHCGHEDGRRPGVIIVIDLVRESCT